MTGKRRPWPRWAKIVRNILLSILLGVLIWEAWDRPTLSVQAALRKKERQMLLPESTAAVEVMDMGPSHWVVQTDGVAIVFKAEQGDVFTNLSARLRPLQEEPALYSFNWTVSLPDEFGQPQTYVVYAAFHPPEGCASSVLNLHNEDGDFVADGIQKEDLFLFYVRPDQGNDIIVVKPYWFDSEEFTYELAFYDEAGNLLKEISE